MAGGDKKQVILRDVYGQNESSVTIGGPWEDGINDRRVRLSPKPAAFNKILGPKGSGNILDPLRATNGMMWPYTPNITDATTVNYEMYDIIHSNQPIAAFKNVAAKELQVVGTFTAQNNVEGLYCLAVIHFLRTVSKMFFGARKPNSFATESRGTPPPILMFNGYGTAIYHNLPVILTNYSIELPQDVDYIQVSPGESTVETARADESAIVLSNFNKKGISAWVPSKFNIAMTLIVQNTPKRLKRFDLDEFRKGGLIKEGGWI